MYSTRIERERRKPVFFMRNSWDVGTMLRIYGVVRAIASAAHPYAARACPIGT